jgi:prepilin-type N-terminal cleavage/methylation domain-containing protein
MNAPRRSSGFTLIEILVAAAILVLLSAALVPLLLTQAQKSRVGRTEGEVHAVAMAFRGYYADTGRWPCNWSTTTPIDEPLLEYACMYSNTQHLDGWNGPYLNKGVTVGEATRVSAPSTDGGYEGIVDAWGNPFEVVFRPADATRPGEAGGLILLLSPGPDRKLETSTAAAVLDAPTGDDLIQIVTRKVR